MEFRVLGPVEVLVDGVGVPLGGPRQRALLAALLLNDGAQTPYQSLVSYVWDEAPDSARANLRRYAWRLRTVLRDPAEPASRLGGGASLGLRILPGESDLAVFTELTEQGRRALGTGDPAGAARLLARALATWRGEAFEGARVSSALESAAAELAERRATTALLHAGARLDIGEHAAVVADLRRLLDADPLREETARLLMLALYRCGRRAEALELFRDTRSRLVRELGIEAGPELADLHRRVLAGDASLLAPVTGTGWSEPAAQLPPPVRGFTGRQEALSSLDALLAEDGPATAVVSGPAGVGKTSLAVRWARSASDRFPDGQLHINLRGFDPSGPAADPAAVLAGFLEALHVPRANIPEDFDTLLGLYRSVLTGRRVLVVLDNARDAAQVRPLLPGAPGCRCLVTSRDRLSGLIATDAALPVPLGVLTAAEAAGFVAARLGPERADADPAAVARLVELCAGLPLALAVVCARAVMGPDLPLSELAAHLAAAGDGLEGFADGDPAADVRSVFSWSYRALDPAAARLFRLLSVHPGPDLSVAAAASVAGEPPEQVAPLLAALAAGHLLTETAPGRYGCHDLLRRYAAELADEDEAAAAFARTVDHYVHTGHAATTLVHAGSDLIELPAAAEGVTVEATRERERAEAWLRSRLPVITALVDLASARGLDVPAWRLAWTVTTALARDGRWRELSELHRRVLPGVERAGDVAAQAYSHRALGFGEVGTGGHGTGHYETAARLYAELGDHLGRARVLRHLAHSANARSRHAEALEHSRAALEAFRAIGHRAGEAEALNGVGWALMRAGEHAEAKVHCERSLEVHLELGDLFTAAATLDSLAHIHHSLGEDKRALECAERALELATRAGGRNEQARTLDTLGTLHLAAGRPGHARAAWERALAIHEENDAAEAAALRGKLAAVP